MLGSEVPHPLPKLSSFHHDGLSLGLDAESIRRSFLEKLFGMQAKFPGVSTTHDHCLSLAYVVRDRLLHRWVHSAHTYLDRVSRTVAYLSAEFMLGPQLANNLLALGIEKQVREALDPLGLDLDTLIAAELEPGLGNGGLGRLAACYMDSLATLDIPAIGYGIRYEFGIFEQGIRGGAQEEHTDKWLRLGNPWFVARPELSFPVGFGGRTEHFTDLHGHYRVRWVPARHVLGTPHDIAVPGYGTANTNFVRLWQAVATESFDLRAFNTGDYTRAVELKVASENITKVLYPNDESPQGKRLRLEQQYFFVCCSLRDMIRLYRQRVPTLDAFPEKWAVQLNDTHPALAIAELMRLLVDEHHLGWDPAWDITKRTFAYTNHTLLPEALETWPLPLFQSTLPRHLEIIYEINRRFLAEVRARLPSDDARLARMSLIDEHGEKRVRMANLATVGSHAVNGVAALHSQLLVDQVMPDFAALEPGKFGNVTNGVTPRRFVRLANPRLSALLDEAIGPGWIRDLDRLSGLEALADDPAFHARWRAIKLANKEHLSQLLERHALGFDPTAMLDVQVKRIHEYKRQHLNLLHVIAQYLRIQEGHTPSTHRVTLLSGKAAPGYFMAKLIIRLAHAVATHVAASPRARAAMQVVFVPNFNVKNAEPIYPAADLSEQISTAGKEASGTGNMKLALNGALTIGTLDGANVELRDRVGAENFFLFGMDAEAAGRARALGYRPRDVAERDPELRAVFDLLRSPHFSPDEPDLFKPLVSNLLDHDPFLVLADYRAYADAQERVSSAWQDQVWWTRASILNVARSGFFSSDRAIREYAERIWNVRSVAVPLEDVAG